MTEQAWTTTITKIDPIPGKDRIVLATIEGYQAIVGRDDYQVGDRVCYISEQTIVPVQLQVELGLVGRLHKDRVKAIKMGGVLSQGIVCRPKQWSFWQKQIDNGQPSPTLDELLGLSRYQPAIPVHLSGKVARPKGWTPIVAMYDVENIKKKRHLDDGQTWFDPFNGKLVCVTEKIHGTNIGIHANASNPDTFYVYSKGIGQNGHVLIEDEQNTYWRAFRKYPQIAEFMRTCLRGEDAVTVYGEVYGRGIQDMNYGEQDIALAIFDVRLWNRREGAFHLTASELLNSHGHAGLPIVPVLVDCDMYNHDLYVKIAQQSSAINGGLREGVVVVSAEGDDYNIDGSRKTAKFINPDYLTRKSGTEYQ